MSHRAETLRERLVAMLKAGPMDRYQLDARFGTRARAASAIRTALEAGDVERVPGLDRGAWQLVKQGNDEAIR